MRPTYLRTLPLVPLYYDPATGMFHYEYDNGNLSVAGNHLSVSSGTEIDGVVLGNSQEIHSLRQKIIWLETELAAIKKASDNE